jgi:predicted TIM-barrel fold metal-dependent hydrolase
MPEWIPRLADIHHWSITLHMQRARSLADPSNLHWINTYCRKYPNMILILDHCARGFNPYHLIEGLKGLDRHHNLYVDTSVICNPLAIWACVDFFGINRVFYGSDFYCSHMRGTNFPLANSFMWIDQEPDLSDQIPYDSTQLLIGLENLRAIKAVFRMLKLTDNEVEAYFWSNAARVLQLEHEP